VDNASNDKTYEIIRKFQQNNFGRIVVSKREKTLSITENWKLSIQEAYLNQEFDYIFPICGDDYLDCAEFIESLVSSAQESLSEIVIPGYINPRWKNSTKSRRRFERIGKHKSLNQLKLVWSHEFGHLSYCLFTRSAYKNIWEKVNKLKNLPLYLVDWWFAFYVFEFRHNLENSVNYVHTDDKNQSLEKYYTDSYYFPDQSIKQQQIRINPNKDRRLVFISNIRRLPFIYWVIFLIHQIFSITRGPFIQLLWKLRELRYLAQKRA
jgi:glycosyltransferase involved in cell wall biosynthesis